MSRYPQLPLLFDPGRRLSMPPKPVLRHSDLRENGRFRYTLTRLWARSQPMLFWVVSHPAASDPANDDAAVKRIMHYSWEFGFGGIVVASLYPVCVASVNDARAWRETTRDTADTHFAAAAATAGKLADRLRCKSRVAAWGRLDQAGHQDLDAWLGHFGSKAPVLCLGVSGNGDPLNPSARGSSRVDDRAGLMPFVYPLPVAGRLTA